MNDSANTPLMQDFIFGALEADENTLAAERRRWSGIRHQFDIDPLDPEPDQLTAYVTVDGREPEGGRGKAVQGVAIDLQRTETRWQPLYWDYAEVWEGELAGQPQGSFVRYRIEGWHSRDASISHWSREMNIDGTADQPAIYGYAAVPPSFTTARRLVLASLVQKVLIARNHATQCCGMMARIPIYWLISNT